jgi:hypothetical protein
MRRSITLASADFQGYHRPRYPPALLHPRFSMLPASSVIARRCHAPTSGHLSIVQTVWALCVDMWYAPLQKTRRDPHHVSATCKAPSPRTWTGFTELSLIFVRYSAQSVVHALPVHFICTLFVTVMPALPGLSPRTLS